MNRFSTNIAAALLTVFVCLPASAFTPSIRDVDITLTLLPDGTASIHERWDVCAADGTEWYLVRGNLGDIEIGNLAVSDAASPKRQAAAASCANATGRRSAGA